MYKTVCLVLAAHAIMSTWLLGTASSASIAQMLNTTWPEELGEYFEGDILEPLPVMDKSGIIDSRYRWPNRQVFYEFDPTFPSDFRVTFQQATNHIAGRTCMRFQAREGETDYIMVRQTNGCSAQVGRVGGEQRMSLADGCGRIGTMIHELVHAIGYHHEQSRTDRDDFVTIHTENIADETLHNFNKYEANYVSPFNVSYDYGSIMHYSSHAFSSNGQPTITPKESGAIIGQRDGLSTKDRMKINNMYCERTLGIRIRSVHDNDYSVLDIQGGMGGEGKVILLSPTNTGDSQRWTVDWSALLNANRGSAIWTFAQDGGRLKVIDEDPLSMSIATRGYVEALNQVWVAEPLSSGFVIKNKLTGRCLYHNGSGAQVRTVSCNSGDVRQQWNIYST